MPNDKWFFTRLDSVERVAREEGNAKQLKVVMDTKSYIKSGTFTTRKHADRVLYYWGKPDRVVSQKTGLSETNIRSIRGTMSEELYRLFGREFLDNLEFGTDESLRFCRMRLSVISMNKGSEDYFSQDILDYIESNSSVEDFDISTCKDEFLFLKKFSLSSFRKEFSTLNPNKVAFLIRVLNRESGSPEDTYSFMRSLDELED